MRKIWLILTAILLSGLVFMSCASSGGSGTGGGNAISSGSGTVPPPVVATVDPLTFKFRHFLGRYVQENWNATNSNESALGAILDHTYVFVGGRKTADYLEYFILEKRDRGVVTLKIQSITINAGGENIVLDLQDLATRSAFSGAPLATTSFANGVLTVNYPNAFTAGENMPRLAVVIPEAKRAAIAGADAVSIKIELVE